MKKENKNQVVLVYIDDIPIYVKPKTTVIQACEYIGIPLPRFCYHDLLNIAGNCRMCLIEVENSIKPQVACGFPVLNNLKVYTNTPIVRKAREAVLEFLLLNHPLDCPICDQGGECDLQNQSIRHGSSKGRFFFSKRVVEDKGFGPVIKTVITRCIHCTRCVRFALEVAGIGELGTCLRGTATEITTYTSKIINSEVSGNLIDLCPVGALTTKSSAFRTRPWETTSSHSIDITDCLGSHVTIESKNYKPIKVVPRSFLNINEEWITDKARFVYEGFVTNRVALPYFYKHTRYYPFNSFNNLNKVLYNFIKIRNKSQFIFGKNLDCETIFLGAYFCKKIGWEFFSENLYYFYPLHGNFFQSTISFLDLSKIKVCIIFGINPRFESSLANLRLNNQIQKGKLQIFQLGYPFNLQYKTLNLGLNALAFLKIITGISSFSYFIFKQFLFLYGDSLSKRIDSHSVLTFVIYFQRLKKAASVNILRLSIGGNSINISFLGLFQKNIIYNRNSTQISNYLLGLQDQILISNLKSKHIVLENSHLIKNSGKFEFLLPFQTIYEKVGNYINFEGKLQSSLTSVLRFGQEPLAFLKNAETTYTSLLKTIIKRFFFDSKVSYTISKLGFFSLKCYLTPLKVLLIDFYRTDPVTTNSLTLSKLSGILCRNNWIFNLIQIS
jgi:NADH-quinone oxidoreductase chain G